MHVLVIKILALSDNKTIKFYCCIGTDSCVTVSKLK